MIEISEIFNYLLGHLWNLNVISQYLIGSLGTIGLGDWLSPNPDSEAIKWLIYVFGGWVESLFTDDPKYLGNQITVLTRVFGLINWLSIILGVMLMSYTVTVNTVNGALKGEFVKQGYSPFWTPLKFALAFLLLHPISAKDINLRGDNGTIVEGEYLASFSQILVLKAAAIGSLWGDKLWEKAAKSMLTVPIVEVPDAGSFVVADHLLSAHICAAALTRQDNMGDINDVDNNSKYHPFRYYKAVASIKAGGTYFVLKDEPIRGGLTQNDLNNASILRFGKSGECGQVVFDASTMGVVGDSSRLYNKAKMLVYDSPDMKASFLELFLAIEGIADQLVLASGSDGHKVFDIIQETNAEEQAMSDGPFWRDMTSPAYDYVSAVATYNDQINSSVRNIFAVAKPSDADESEIDTFLEEYQSSVIDGGWLKAGWAYFEITRIQDGFNQAINHYKSGIASSSIPYKKCEPEVGFWNEVGQAVVGLFSEPECKASIILADDRLANVLKENAYKMAAGQHMHEISNQRDFKNLAADATGNVKCNKDGCASNSLDLNWFSAAGFAQIMLPDDSQGNMKNKTNPFVVASDMGHRILNTAFVSLIPKILALQMSAAGMKESAKWLPGVGSALAIGAKLMEMISVGLIGFVMAMIPLGFILAFLIPFLPVLYWINIGIGWLFTVVLAYLAAPIGVIMMAVPEGDGISGMKAQRILAMILALFLTPSLVVCGLLISVTIAYVGFGHFNELFWLRATSEEVLMSEGQVAGSIIEPFALLILYVSALVSFITYIIDIIPNTRNKILEWVTSYASEPFGETEASKNASASISNTSSSALTGFLQNASRSK